MSRSANAIRRAVTGAESQIYRDLMRFKPSALSPNAWAVKAGVSRTVWADMRRHGNPSRRTLEKLLAVADTSVAEFEALRLGPDPESGHAARGLADRRWDWNAPAPALLPLIASRAAGEWGQPGSQVELSEIRSSQIVDCLPRPASLAADPDAFALTIVGEAMWPRFRPGVRIAVSPRAAIAPGDDVLVRLRGSADETDGWEPVLIKQLGRIDRGGVELRQFSPAITIHIEQRWIISIARIPGELI